MFKVVREYVDSPMYLMMCDNRACAATATGPALRRVRPVRVPGAGGRGIPVEPGRPCDQHGARPHLDPGHGRAQMEPAGHDTATQRPPTCPISWISASQHSPKRTSSPHRCPGLRNWHAKDWPWANTTARISDIRLAEGTTPIQLPADSDRYAHRHA